MATGMIKMDEKYAIGIAYKETRYGKHKSHIIPPTELVREYTEQSGESDLWFAYETDDIFYPVALFDHRKRMVQRTSQMYMTMTVTELRTDASHTHTESAEALARAQKGVFWFKAIKSYIFGTIEIKFEVKEQPGVTLFGKQNKPKPLVYKVQVKKDIYGHGPPPQPEGRADGTLVDYVYVMPPAPSQKRVRSTNRERTDGAKSNNEDEEDQTIPLSPFRKQARATPPVDSSRRLSAAPGATATQHISSTASTIANNTSVEPPKITKVWQPTGQPEKKFMLSTYDQKTVYDDNEFKPKVHHYTGTRTRQPRTNQDSDSGSTIYDSDFSDDLGQTRKPNRRPKGQGAQGRTAYEGNSLLLSAAQAATTALLEESDVTNKEDDSPNIVLTAKCKDGGQGKTTDSPLKWGNPIVSMGDTIDELAVKGPDSVGAQQGEKPVFDHMLLDTLGDIQEGRFEESLASASMQDLQPLPLPLPLTMESAESGDSVITVNNSSSISNSSHGKDQGLQVPNLESLRDIKNDLDSILNCDNGRSKNAEVLARLRNELDVRAKIVRGEIKTNDSNASRRNKRIHAEVTVLLQIKSLLEARRGIDDTLKLLLNPTVSFARSELLNKRRSQRP